MKKDTRQVKMAWSEKERRTAARRQNAGRHKTCPMMVDAKEPQATFEARLNQIRFGKALQPHDGNGWVFLPDLRALTSSQLGELLRMVTGHLEQRARGGEAKATGELLTGAQEINDKLRWMLAASEPLSSMLKRQVAFPVNLPVRKRDRDSLITRVLRAGLGSENDLNFAGQWKKDDAIGIAVLIVFLHLRRARDSQRAGDSLSWEVHLAEVSPTDEMERAVREWLRRNLAIIPAQLTRENSREWADLSQPLIEILWGKDFHTHSHFKSLAVTKSGSPRGTIRGEIRRLWRRSWGSAANPTRDLG